MTFSGFSRPNKKDGYFCQSQDFFDTLMSIKSVAEMKVVLYIWRHTWGFKEYNQYKIITIDDFMHGRVREDGSRIDEGTGLSNRAIIDGLAKAEEHSYIESINRSYGRKAYRLHSEQCSLVDSEESSNHNEDCSLSLASYNEESSNDNEQSSNDNEESSNHNEQSSSPIKKDTLDNNSRKILEKEGIVEVPLKEEIAEVVEKAEEQHPLPTIVDLSEHRMPVLALSEQAEETLVTFRKLVNGRKASASELQAAQNFADRGIVLSLSELESYAKKTGKPQLWLTDVWQYCLVNGMPTREQPKKRWQDMTAEERRAERQIGCPERKRA